MSEKTCARCRGRVPCVTTDEVVWRSFWGVARTTESTTTTVSRKVAIGCTQLTQTDTNPNAGTLASHEEYALCQDCWLAFDGWVKGKS